MEKLVYLNSCLIYIIKNISWRLITANYLVPSTESIYLSHWFIKSNRYTVKSLCSQNERIGLFLHPDPLTLAFPGHSCLVRVAKIMKELHRSKYPPIKCRPLGSGSDMGCSCWWWLGKEWRLRSSRIGSWPGRLALRSRCLSQKCSFKCIGRGLFRFRLEGWSRRFFCRFWGRN